MGARLLTRHAVERIWGRAHLPGIFAGLAGHARPIGEIWFANLGGSDAELLVKYLFTSQRLSIQVHPDDDFARAQGWPRGKSEAWFVLAAEPDAVIGLGLRDRVPKEALRAAALDGTIETLIDWRPVKAGDFLYSPAGTVHAIGAGVSLIEIQQNLDLTYRLYDYGRPRELHLDEAVAVADPAPLMTGFVPYEQLSGRTVLTAGNAFVVERWTFSAAATLTSADGQLLLIPLHDGGVLDGNALEHGSVWRVDGRASLDPAAGMDLLAAYPGGTVVEEICVFI